MENLKLVESKKGNNLNHLSEKLYKGACVKIKNSPKTFQVIGINPENQICWLREWPFSPEVKKTFALGISQITLQIFCSSQFLE